MALPLANSDRSLRWGKNWKSQSGEASFRVVSLHPRVAEHWLVVRKSFLVSDANLLQTVRGIYLVKPDPPFP